MGTITVVGPELGSPGWFKYWLRRSHENTIQELLLTCKAFNHKNEQIAQATIKEALKNEHPDTSLLPDPGLLGSHLCHRTTTIKQTRQCKGCTSFFTTGNIRKIWCSQACHIRYLRRKKTDESRETDPRKDP